MMKQRQINKSYKHLAKDSDDSSGEETELFVRNKSPKREIPSTEKNIEEGDTLQSLAIRYYCTIEDLKRLNNIHKENEIFARRTIKVPHRQFSEALVTVHMSAAGSPSELSEPPTAKLVDIDSLGSRLEQSQENNEVNDIIFNSNITQKPSGKVEEDNRTNPDETVQLIEEKLPKSDPLINRLNCNGSDWDIPWPALIFCIVVVILVLPIIYVFYIAEHPEIYLNHTNSNGS